MLLRLSASEAMGRAAFALASVGIACTGHVALGHEHCDFSQVVVASLGLIFMSWRTRRTSHLLGAALLAQVVVHGGIPTQLHMLAIHIVAATLALGLMHHSEQIWRALSNVLLPRLPRLSMPVPIATPRIIDVAQKIFIGCTPLRALSLRGPPAFA